MSIRNRILLFAILATLIPLVGLGWFYLDRAEHALRHSVRQQLHADLDRARRELRLWLEARRSDLRVFASSHLVADPPDSGRVLGSGAGHQDLRDFLALVQEQYPLYSSFRLFDEEGRPRLREPVGGPDWSLPEDWRLQLERKHPVASVLLEKGMAPRLALAVPLLSREGEVRGLLGAVLDEVSLARWFSALLHPDRGTVPGTLMLVDDAGRVLLAGGEDAVRKRLAHANLLLARDGMTTAYRAGRGRQVLASSGPVEGYPWSLVLERDREALFAGLRVLRREAIGVVLVVVALIGFLAWWMARDIVAPLGRLTSAAQQVAQGDLDVSLSVARSDEIGFAAVVFNDMVMQLRQNRERLEALTTTDALTGLLNRKGIAEVFATFLARYRRHRRPFAVIMLDIDHFKAINDRYGHLAGDHVLREVSRLLVEVRSPVDVVGRYGGEEFIILLDETPGETAFLVAERMRHSIAGMAVSFDNLLLRVTASFGVVEIANGGESMEELVARADKAMYRAKQGGRNRTVLDARSGRELSAETGCRA